MRAKPLRSSVNSDSRPRASSIVTSCGVVEAVPARHAWRRLDAVGGRLLGTAFQVMKRRGDGIRGYGDIERHDRFSDVELALRRISALGRHDLARQDITTAR